MLIKHLYHLTMFYSIYTNAFSSDLTLKYPILLHHVEALEESSTFPDPSDCYREGRNIDKRQVSSEPDQGKSLRNRPRERERD